MIDRPTRLASIPKSDPNDGFFYFVDDTVPTRLSVYPLQRTVLTVLKPLLFSTN